MIARQQPLGASSCAMLRQEFATTLDTSPSVSMTPQMQMAVRFLQIPLPELIEALRAELEQNPLLEEADDSDAELLEEEAKLVGAEPRSSWRQFSPRRTWEVLDERLGGAIPWPRRALELMNPQTGLPLCVEEGDVPLEKLDEASDTGEGHRHETLQDYLQHWLGLSKILPIDRAIGTQIIGNLNEAGFLDDAEATSKTICTTLNCRSEHVQRIIELIRGIGPPGIVAADVREQLLLQLRHRHLENALCHKLLLNYPHHLISGDLRSIARAERVDVTEVRKALAELSRLHPDPTSRFTREVAEPIQPDITIRKVGHDFMVVANEEGLPALTISDKYGQLLTDRRFRGPTRGFVRDRLRDARFLLRALQSRQSILLRVAQLIVKLQRDFLEGGAAYLKPLSCRDLAERLGLHDSTVSRATSGTWVDGPLGVLPMRDFFAGGLARSSGEEIAITSVKHRIQVLIKGENPEKPLSDQALVTALSSVGINVARRTVAKYRESMGIESARQRGKRLSSSESRE